MMRRPTAGGMVIVAGATLLASVGWPCTAGGQLASRARFVSHPPFAVRVGPDVGRQAMALADLDGDQRLDLVAIAPDDSRVEVFLNLGDGRFELVATPDLDQDVTPTAIAIADVGSPFASDAAGRPDGLLDLIVGGDFGEVVVMYGLGNGGVDPEQQVIEPDATSWIRGLVVGDFAPGDGLDVALLDEDGVVLLCSGGFGQLAPCSGDAPLDAGFDPRAIAAGDFNADGRPDLAVLDGDDQLLWPFIATGPAAFAAGAPVDVSGDSASGPSVDLAVGRLDGDAFDDLVVANADDFGLLMGVGLFGSPAGTFRIQPFVLDFEATAIALGDFADRGPLDVIAGYSGFDNNGLSLNIGLGDGRFADPFVPLGSGSVTSAALILARDVDGDRQVDVVALDAEGEQVRVLLNRSTPSCIGDCDENGAVSVDELVRGVNMLLNGSDLGACLALDGNGDRGVTVDELVAAVASALAGCRNP